MAATFFHKGTGRWLTSMGRDAKPGDVAELSMGSLAFNQPPGAFGFRGCQFTRYTLAQPVAVDEWGEPLFDLKECSPRCPLDDSPQTDEFYDWRWSYKGQREAVEAIAAFAAAFAPVDA